MKNRCYPKYSFVLYFILSAVMLVFSAGPLFIKTNEGLFVKIIWSTLMLALGIVFAISAIRCMQYFYFENDNIVVRSLFGTIVELNIKKVKVYVETLPTYFSWISSIDIKWICIYDETIANNLMNKFKFGCSNKNRFKRIKIVFNEKNSKFIEQYLKINKREIYGLETFNDGR